MLPLRVGNGIPGLFDLANCLKALDAYACLSGENARDYDKLKKARLQRYDFTEQGYCERFRNANQTDKNHHVS